jgi:8-oxo-dGTP diphosphatase
LSHIFSMCVDGIYVKNGEILLLKRNVEPFKGFWHVVGGHVEENETLKEALQREFKEETNLDVEIGQILGNRIEKTSDRTKIIIIFKINAAKGEIKLNSESAEYGWFHDLPSDIVYNYWKYI